jgi:hypothetical protein
MSRENSSNRGENTRNAWNLLQLDIETIIELGGFIAEGLGNLLVAIVGSP